MYKLTTPSHDYDLEALFPWLVGKSRRTTRLHPRRATRLSPESSKVGGTILWPADEEWPTCSTHNTPYVPVLQLNLSDVPLVEFPPGKDLMQVLWCPNDHEEVGYAPRVLLFWHKKSKISQPLLSLPEPSRFENFYIPAECTLHPEIVAEYPDVMSLSDEQLDEIINWGENKDASYQYSLSVAPGFKIGGYAPWIQHDETPVCNCDATMEYFLTIDDAEFDGGTYERWLPAEERHIWDAPFKERTRVQRAAGLMLGDMGAINVFVCKQHHPWEVWQTFQCS